MLRRQRGRKRKGANKEGEGEGGVMSQRSYSVHSESMLLVRFLTDEINILSNTVNLNIFFVLKKYFMSFCQKFFPSLYVHDV